MSKHIKPILGIKVEIIDENLYAFCGKDICYHIDYDSSCPHVDICGWDHGGNCDPDDICSNRDD